MTKNEIKNLIAWAAANFPHLQEKDLRPTAALWAKMLADIPYATAEAALMKVLSTSKFFPTVAGIRAAAVDLSSPRLPSAAEAWGEVTRAISRHGYYGQEEALASMSPPVASVVRLLGWREICLSEEPEILRAQFRKAYETQVGRDREMMVLPEGIRGMIKVVAANMPKLPDKH